MNDMSYQESNMPCDPTSSWRQSESGSVGVKWATGHGDVGDQAYHGNWASGIKIWNIFRIGTWNVRGLLETGNLNVVEKEIKSYGIVGLSETHWTDKGHFTSKNHNDIYFSGNDNQSRNGVAVVVNKDIKHSVKEYITVSDRIIVVRFKASPVNLNVVQIYAPTSEAKEEEIDAFYNKLEETLEKLPNREISIVLGDFNAKIGATKEDHDMRGTVGLYGLGERNARGERLLHFCTENNLFIANTGFQHHPRRLYTWISPGNRYRNQIDYILVKSRWKTIVKDVKTYPGMDCNSDHQFLSAELRMKLRKHKKTINERPRWHLRNNDTYTRAVIPELHRLKRAAESQESPNIIWTETKSILNNAAKGITNDTKGKRKQWITDVTWDRIQVRKQLKASGLEHENEREAYQALNIEIKRLCQKDKNSHLNQLCKEIEEHKNKTETKDMFKKIKQITRSFAPNHNAIKDENGVLLTARQDILNRWREYCENLMMEEDVEESPTQVKHSFEKEPDILRSEVEIAIRRQKSHKATGIDNIPIEMIWALDDIGVDIMHRICQKIWETCTWPEDWTTSIYIPLHKKGARDLCSNYRTIALITHCSKIMLQIILARIKPFLLPEIPEEQAGFVPGRGTREQILNIRQIIEKSREFNITTYMCFIDYSKAFDLVNWRKLWQVLSEMGVPFHLILLIRNLYNDGCARVRVNGELTGNFCVTKGVRQGCILSPILFNIYGEWIMRRATDGWNGGITIGGRKISNLRYADDTTIFARSEEELCQLLDRIENISIEAGLKINRTKTRIMVIDRANNNQNQLTEINNIAVVSQLVYLGSTITNTGGCTEEIKRRSAIAKNAMAKLTKIWKSHEITVATKMRLVRCLVFPIFLYAAECWTLKETDKKSIDAFEMFCWRRMLRIPWTARRTNVSILEQLNIKKRLRTQVTEQIIGYFGHVFRRNGLEKLAIQGGVEGKRGRGRSPTRYTDHIVATIGVPLSECARMTEDREKWRGIAKTNS